MSKCVMSKEGKENWALWNKKEKAWDNVEMMSKKMDEAYKARNGTFQEAWEIYLKTVAIYQSLEMAWCLRKGYVQDAEIEGQRLTRTLMGHCI